MRPLAVSEVKAIMKIHLSLLYEWSNANATQGTVDPKVRKALLDMLARMFELVEDMPARTTTH
jgi:hypothetical protein